MKSSSIGLDIESSYCVIEDTLVTIVDVEDTLVFSARKKSNPHFASATTSGLHSGRHGSTFFTVL